MCVVRQNKKLAIQSELQGMRTVADTTGQPSDEHTGPGQTGGRGDGPAKPEAVDVENSLANWETAARNARSMADGPAKDMILDQAEAEITRLNKLVQENKPLEARVGEKNAKVQELRQALGEAEAAHQETSGSLTEAEQELKAVTESQWHSLGAVSGPSQNTEVFQKALELAQSMMAMQEKGLSKEEMAQAISSQLGVTGPGSPGGAAPANQENPGGTGPPATGETRTPKAAPSVSSSDKGGRSRSPRREVLPCTIP